MTDDQKFQFKMGICGAGTLVWIVFMIMSWNAGLSPADKLAAAGFASFFYLVFLTIIAHVFLSMPNNKR